MFKFLKDKLSNWAKKIAKAEEKREAKKEPEKIEKAKTKIEQKDKEKPVKEEKIKKPEKTIEKRLEEADEKEKQEAEEEKQGFFARLKSKFTKIKISENEFDIYANELEELLLENNVAFEVAEKIISGLKQEIVGKELLKKEIEGEIKDVFKEIIRKILIEPFDVAEKIKEKNQKEKTPYVIVFFGINGTGKTTTIAKVTEFLKKQNLSCVLAAADTFRAASIEQLQKHGERLGVKVIANSYGSDPASVGVDAVAYAKRHYINAVLIDTAGRMHTAKDLLREMEKIVRVTKPDLKVFIGESITGNDAVEQAKSFNWSVGIDGIILTKADIDEKGGTALSVGYVIKKPILYLGTGQEYNAIEPFSKEKFIERLGL